MRASARGGGVEKWSEELCVERVETQNFASPESVSPIVLVVQVVFITPKRGCQTVCFVLKTLLFFERVRLHRVKHNF